MISTRNVGRRSVLLAAIGLVVAPAASPSRADDPPAAGSVAAIVARHDRELIKDLAAHLSVTPRPDDADAAYLTLFNKAIEHDWFLDHETIARSYLKDYPEGPVRPLAQIIATMARAQAGAYQDALANYKILLEGLGGPEQAEFAQGFADSLAGSAAAAGEAEVARGVYTLLLKKFGEENATLKQKVVDDLARLDRFGKPAPAIGVKDLDGNSFRFDDAKGSYVLVDFWATWCAPCLAELPRVQAAEAKYRGKGLKVVSISLDETKAAVVDFVRVRKLPWTQIHNATAAGDLVQAFGVNTIPATFLIDPKGTIVRIDLRGAALDKTLESLIK